MIAGIDIGGTKTHLRFEVDDRAVFDRTILTDEWRGRSDMSQDIRNLASIILTDMSPTITVIGAHGCDSDDDRLALQVRLSALLPGTLLVLNDSELLLPACGKETGIAVISGTGSIAVSRDVDRSMIAAGGWGWFLGDEGSASGLVRDAARAVRLALDGGEAIDILGLRLLEGLGIASPIDLGRAIAAIGTAAGIGQLAPVVFHSADEGSAIARNVIEKAGTSLSFLTEQLIKRGAFGADVVTGGGVITRQPRLFDAFRSALARRAPAATLTLVEQPPVLGALELARSIGAGNYPPRLPMPHVNGRPLPSKDGRAA
ncbi:N-acetylglucosamine kinase [Rhizobium leguminosarum]|uniref:N-acetylglucosamine kinase n=1 Tax=Rhizobium leguminosarum TaxID=384 RepID=UPI001C9588B2|nr:BadF/BadG/BcrA/BcrD ATPase family protein [Rhizobium leguminosarum]MBY5699224.1 N-acetylglucosamine kinase [Rhizobium leguminosarum]